MTRLSNLRAARRMLALASLALGSAMGLAPCEAQILGFKGGVSVSHADFDSDSSFDRGDRTGYVGGAFFNWSAGPFGFQPEISYATLGFDEHGADGLSLHYLTGTALLKLGIPLVVVKPGIFGGLSYGFKTHCELNGEDCDDAGLDVKGTDANAVFGADVAVFFGKVSLWGDGRYNIGIKEINGTDDIFRTVKNRAWQFQAGIGFKLD